MEGSRFPLRVLLVDDDIVLLEALQRGLDHARMYQVTACSTFEDGRRHLREHPVDVLITDVRLGAFNGLQLALIARDLYPTVQVVVFSGYDDSVIRADAEQIGAIYVVKPVTTAELIALIRSRTEGEGQPGRTDTSSEN